MKFLVIGAGNTGHAAVAYLISKGGECRLYTRDPQKAAVINKNGILSTGAADARVPVNAFTDLGEAVRGVDCVLVMTTANAHREVCQNLRPFLERGQSVVIFNGNWGAFEFQKLLGEDIAAKGLTVAETGAQLFLSSSKEPGKVHFELKKQVPVAATDPDKTPHLIDRMAAYFPQFAPMGCIYETSLSNTNPVIHGPVTLLNAVRVENGQPFHFYGDGLSPSAVNMILALDAERIALAKKLGCEIEGVLSGINSFWPVKHDNLFDALHKNERYIKSLGPSTFNHRYVTEDIPYGIAPISKLGRCLGIATPYADMVVTAFSALLGKNMMDEGVSFTKEDFPHVL